MTTQSMGIAGEDKATDFLRRKGYRIKTRNYRSRFGEIDIIAFDGLTIVFIEVKLRSHERFGSGLEVISTKKLDGLIATAHLFLKHNKLEHHHFRFDAIYISPLQIEHIQNITL